MALHVSIALDGPVTAKGRPRATVREDRQGIPRATLYPDGKTVKYEAQLRLAAMKEMVGRTPTAQPIKLLMVARFAIPTTWSAKKHAAALLGHVWPCIRPDSDNFLKLIDAFNGIVWLDDKQVVDAQVRKVYAETPGILIEIKTIEPPALPQIAARQVPRPVGDLFAS